jgi:hypothetical protein
VVVKKQGETMDGIFDGFRKEGWKGAEFINGERMNGSRNGKNGVNRVGGTPHPNLVFWKNRKK